MLANFLKDQYGQRGVSVDELVRKQMAKAQKSSITLSYDAAYDL